MKIYNKKGNHNFKERKLEKALKEFFEKNPDKYQSYQIPTTFDQLKAYHDEFCTEDATIVSETKETHDSFKKGMEETVETNYSNKDREVEDLFSREDPMNREEPIIRDYVKDDGFEKTDEKEPEKKSSYEEPKNFKDSFEIPNDNIEEGDKKQSGPINQRPYEKTSSSSSSYSSASSDEAKVNRKSKRRFSRYTVDALCALSGRVLVWYATKDVTEQKLTEYIEQDQIAADSLELIVYLDAHTEGTVKQFFQMNIARARELAEYTKDEREDLAYALEAILDYKKIEINPVIEGMTIFLGMHINRALASIELNVQNKSILNQIRDHYAGTDRHHDHAHQQHHTETVNEQPSTQTQTQQSDDVAPDAGNETDTNVELDETIETRE
jgi:hypothetical protein